MTGHPSPPGGPADAVGPGRQLHAPRLRRQVVVWLLPLLVAGLATALLMAGSMPVSAATVLRVLLGEQVEGASFAVGTIRLPRMLAGLLTGMAFGMAGSTFQTMLRNPLASPDVIGISAGACTAAVFLMLVLRLDGTAVSLAAAAAGLSTTACIFLLAGGGVFSGGRLILTGIGVQALLQAVTSWLLLRASQYDIPAAMRWLSGSLNGVRMAETVPLAVAVCLGGGALLFLDRPLRVLELGDAVAVSLGVRPGSTRLLLSACAVVLIAAATAVAGPIAFVAFLSGPVAGRLTGGVRPHALVSGLVGASLVLGADLAGQTAFGTRFPVGVVTGLVGAPVLLAMLVRLNTKGVS